MARETAITERTLIPLWAIFPVIPFAVGAMVWLTTVYIGQQNDAKRIESLEIKIETQYSLLLEVRERLIRIEARQKSKE